MSLLSNGTSVTTRQLDALTLQLDVFLDLFRHGHQHRCPRSLAQCRQQIGILLRKLTQTDCLIRHVFGCLDLRKFCRSIWPLTLKGMPNSSLAALTFESSAAVFGRWRSYNSTQWTLGLSWTLARKRRLSHFPVSIYVERGCRKEIESSSNDIKLKGAAPRSARQRAS